jgi:general secretion pathway protein G
LVQRRENGFTLIELLVTMAIIAILVAIAIPNLLNAIQHSRQKRSMADMRSIGTAWESRATDTGKYNAAGTGLPGISSPMDINALEGIIAPTYIKEIPKKDGWSNPFVCYTDLPIGTGQAQKYAIVSGGADSSVATNLVVGPFSNFDCDIVFSGGVFIAYPQGVQMK